MSEIDRTRVSGIGRDGTGAALGPAKAHGIWHPAAWHLAAGLPVENIDLTETIIDGKHGALGSGAK